MENYFAKGTTFFAWHELKDILTIAWLANLNLENVLPTRTALCAFWRGENYTHVEHVQHTFGFKISFSFIQNVIAFKSLRVQVGAHVPEWTTENERQPTTVCTRFLFFAFLHFVYFGNVSKTLGSSLKAKNEFEILLFCNKYELRNKCVLLIKKPYRWRS